VDPLLLVPLLDPLVLAPLDAPELEPLLVDPLAEPLVLVPLLPDPLVEPLALAPLDAPEPDPPLLVPPSSAPLWSLDPHRATTRIRPTNDATRSIDCIFMKGSPFGSTLGEASWLAASVPRRARDAQGSNPSPESLRFDRPRPRGLVRAGASDHADALLCATEGRRCARTDRRLRAAHSGEAKVPKARQGVILGTRRGAPGVTGA
jgi:hypothetical protein